MNKIIPLEKRLKDNIKNYRLDHLFHEDMMHTRLRHLAELLDVDVLLTDRNGEKAFVIGGFIGFEPDAANKPGIKIQVAGRTMGHLYVKYDRVPEEKRNFAKEVLEDEAAFLAAFGEERYHGKETAFYLEELEHFYVKEQVQDGDQEDILTGTLSRACFENKIKAMEDSQVVPAAVLLININDWKYANDHFGDEESDRLIQIVASIVKEEAKPDYIIGRYDGDVFCVLVPMPEDDEAWDYCRKVQERCDAYEDVRLSPSVACGVAYKTNLEESIQERISDAEYEMFDNKFQIKNAAGYRERLTRAK